MGTRSCTSTSSSSSPSLIGRPSHSEDAARTSRHSSHPTSGSEGSSNHFHCRMLHTLIGTHLTKIKCTHHHIIFPTLNTFGACKIRDCILNKLTKMLRDMHPITTSHPIIRWIGSATTIEEGVGQVFNGIMF